MRITFAGEEFELVRNSVLSQVALVGLICFCEPGLYNAIISMAGGINDPELISTSNTIVYATFALSSLVAPALINAIGPRWSLTLGTTGYWFYVGSLYFYQRGTVGGWAVNAAAVAIGSCAGPLWTAQNALCLAYPPLERKGQYFSVFWIVFNLGGVVGGVITLVTNWHSSSSNASGSTFLLFIALMMAGSLLATTLAPPEDVVRPDGSSVVVQSLSDYRAEARATLALFKHREMLLLTPLFAYTGWFYPYQFGVFNAGLFNARTQGLCNTFYWGAQMLGAHWIGKHLDSVPEGGGRATRATRALYWLSFATVSTWLVAAYINSYFDLTVSTRLGMDFESDFEDFLGPAALYISWGFLDAFIQCYTYWLFGQLTSSVSMTARMSGYMKFVGALCAAISWKLGVVSSMTQIGLNLALFLLALPMAQMVAASLPDSTRAVRRSVPGLPGLDGTGEGYSKATALTPLLTLGGARGAQVSDLVCFGDTVNALQRPPPPTLETEGAEGEAQAVGGSGDAGANTVAGWVAQASSSGAARGGSGSSGGSGGVGGSGGGGAAMAYEIHSLELELSD